MIGIIGAMESEVKAIYEKMTSKQEIKLCDLTFYKGFLWEKEVVVVKCGVGKVLVLKYKSKKDYHRLIGHRQQYTKVRVESITLA